MRTAPTLHGVVSLAALALALGAGGCATPKTPEIRGLTLTRFTPGNAEDGQVRVPLELLIQNPNAYELEVQAERIRIVSREGGEKILGVGAFATPVVVGPGGPDSEAQRVETTLAVDRDSWDRSIFQTIRAGKAFVVGPVKVVYKGKTYDTEIDLPLPGRPEEGGGKLLPLEVKLTKVRIELVSLSRLHLRAELDARSDIGQAITLTGVTLTIAAPGTRKPMTLVLAKDVTLPAQDRGTVALEGDVDLEQADATLLDDIEANGRKASARLRGAAQSTGFPATDFDEQVDLGFAGDGGGVAVELARPELALFADVLGGTQQSSSLLNGLETLSRLARFEETPVRFSLKNPIPGTLTVLSSEAVLLGPYNPDRKRRMEVLALRMAEQALPPRVATDVEAKMQLLKDGERSWKAVAVDATRKKLGDYCLATSWRLKLPVFGEVSSEKSYGPVYGDSREDCSRR